MTTETGGALAPIPNLPAIEHRWRQRWEELGLHRYRRSANSRVFSIDTPPRYVSAAHLHVGHAMSGLPAAARDIACESIGGTQAVVAATHESFADHGASLLDASSRAFADAMHITAGLSTAAVIAAFIVVLIWMPRQRGTTGKGRLPGRPRP